MTLSENEAQSILVEILTSINQVGKLINRIGSKETHETEALLTLIAENAIKVVPDASAVIYKFNEISQNFELDSRVAVGNWLILQNNDAPRIDGFGWRAINLQRRVLSYEENELMIHPLRSKAGAKIVGCFPLIVAEKILGILYVYLREKRIFSQQELLMLENFVNHAAMAIYQSRQITQVQQDLTRKEEELSRLRRSGLLISSRLRLEETLEAILQMALEITGAHFGIFRLLDKAGKNLITQAVAGEFAGKPHIDALPLDQRSVMGWVAVNREAVRIPDLREEPWASQYFPFDSNIEMRSELAVPIIDASGRLEGVINLESPMVGAFGEEDNHMLQALATQAVIAIQDTRLLDVLQDLARYLLLETGQQVFTRLVDLACNLLNAAASAIWILDGDNLNLQTASSNFPRDRNIPLHGSLTGLAVLNQSTIISNDIRIDKRFHRSDIARKYGWTRALIVPIQSDYNKEPIGAFSVYSIEPEPGRFAESDWDKKVLTCLAQYAALTVKNEMKREELTKIQEQKAVAETFAAVGDIAANLLHNLNNKVGTIPVRIQGIQDKCEMAIQADSYLEMNLKEIERSASDALITVRDNLVHLHPIVPIPISVAGCVAEAILAAHLPLGISVRTIGLEKIPHVIAGERSLILVFTNLFENASNAMKGHGSICIQGKEILNQVEIDVSDDGPGIPVEIQERIFEPDFSGSHSKSPGKLGFGLWWVKTVMTRMGGSVIVESEKYHGTSFKLKLPKTRITK